MSPALPSSLKEVLSDKLGESLARLPPVGTRRLVHGNVALPGKVTAVVGMRRVGKTTFMHQMRHERLNSGGHSASIPYINFEDERLAELRAPQLGFLVEEHRRRVPTGAPGRTLWCFDEIQVVDGWERFVRRLLDTGDCDIVVTGSSSALLSREIATTLRGRAWEVPLFPFSFAEARQHARLAHVPTASRRSDVARADLEREFLAWLISGGFPEANGLDTASRMQLLRDYVDVAILRDVVERHRVSNVTALRWLVRHLLGNAGGHFSLEKFHAALKSQGIAVSKDTLHAMLAQVEDCFLIRTIWMEASSERQRMVNPRKAYPVDAGLIPVFDRSGRANVGHALETAVLIELQRRRCDVTYVRTPAGYEVDFLARYPDGREELIQVCADASDPTTATRELRALADAAPHHPRAKRRLLTLTRDGGAQDPPRGIAMQPTHDWMLAEPGE